MEIEEKTEFQAIERWTAALPTTGPDVLVGPGDDVAWLRARGAMALSVDTVVEGVHFRRHWASAADLGWRAAAAALSDLAASRARPTGMLVALSVRELDDWADGLLDGIGQAARRFDCPVLGGDTTATPGPATLSVTVLGAAVGEPLLRSGAQPGDLVLLSGRLGASAHATARLLNDERVDWPRPSPRLDLLDRLGPATAGIDISDGLLADALHVAQASGVTIALDPARVVAAGATRHEALCGGEDYELLVTCQSPIEGFEVVGTVGPGPAGVRLIDGSDLPDGPWGWDHGGTA